MKKLLLASAILGLSVINADAHHYRHVHHVHPVVTMLGVGFIHMMETAHQGEQIVAHPSGCPRTAFCGCGVSVKVFGHPVRDLYLAANWLHFPRASAAPGNVAVYGHHHVAYIESVNDDGTALLYDPNSGGHLTRIHVRQLPSTIVRPGA